MRYIYFILCFSIINCFFDKDDGIETTLNGIYVYDNGESIFRFINGSDTVYERVNNGPERLGTYEINDGYLRINEPKDGIYYSIGPINFEKDGFEWKPNTYLFIGNNQNLEGEWIGISEIFLHDYTFIGDSLMVLRAEADSTEILYDTTNISVVGNSITSPSNPYGYIFKIKNDTLLLTIDFPWHFKKI